MYTVAITSSATRSSTTAMVRSRSRSRVPRGASSASAPSARAVSVDIAAPQPCAPLPPALNARNMATGTAIPPSAAATGIARRWRSRSSPVSSSRLASSPTTRKKSVIKPSFTQCRRSSEMPPLPMVIESFVVQNDSYESDQGELAHRSAATAAASRTIAPPVSALRKSRTGVARFRAHAVLSENLSDPPPRDSASASALIFGTLY